MLDVYDLFMCSYKPKGIVRLIQSLHGEKVEIPFAVEISVRSFEFLIPLTNGLDDMLRCDKCCVGF